MVLSVSISAAQVIIFPLYSQCRTSLRPHFAIYIRVSFHFLPCFFSASQDDVKNNIEIMSVGGLQLVKLTINPLWEASFFFTMAMLALSGSYRYRLRRLQPFWCAIIICSFIVCISQVCESTPVLSPPKTRVFGPGIHAKRSALPVNYFYIQAVDSAGKK